MYIINHKIRIKGSNEYLISKEKKGRSNNWMLSSGKVISQKDLKTLECQCVGCKRYVEIKLNHNLLHREKYQCYSCVKKGKKNPFYNKSHSTKTKKKHSDYMKGRYVGKNNAFFGKTHTQETRKILSEKCGRFGEDNGFFGKTHTQETRNILSTKSRKWALNNLDKMSEYGIKSVGISAKGRKTKPEKLVEGKLKELGIPYKYNKIFKNIGQFDFILYDTILLEVNGDYWHGNPNIYGKNKKPLNERQLYKRQRDVEKREAVEEIGYKVFYIWERDIKNGNFGIIYEIQTTQN